MANIKVNGIELNADNIAYAISKYYPNTITPIIKNKLYGYVLLWGIRVKTCDTGLPDDYLGGIKYNSLGNWDFVFTEGTVDPSPAYLKKMHDAEALKKGGTAWVKNGQHIYYYVSYWNGYPAFAPKKPLNCWRWNPSYEGEKFDQSKAISSTVSDTFIHRNWAFEKGGERFVNDSAGCQVVKDNKSLKTLGEWASRHIKLYKANSFVYTLLSSEEWTKAFQFQFNPSLIIGDWSWMNK